MTEISRWRHEPAIFLVEQLGELDAVVVAVLRADDLNADRQAVAVWPIGATEAAGR